MSKLGNIHDSFGKQFSIAIANTYVDNVLNANNLPKNTIILSSPYDASSNEKEDLGTPAIVITDNEGVGVLLTKSISAKNGLVYSNDSLCFSIDNKTIKTNEDNELYVDISALANNTGIGVGTFGNKKGKLFVDNNAFEIASKTNFGVAMVDGITVKSDNGVLSINASGLDHATQQTFGTVIGDDKTMSISNGVPQINTANLTKASPLSYGVAKIDNVSLRSTNGTISAINESLISSNNEIGLLKVDGLTIVSNNGVLSIDTNGFQKASETTYGMVKINKEQFETNENGQLVMKGYDNLVESINDISNRIQIASQQVSQIENDVANI